MPALSNTGLEYDLTIKQGATLILNLTCTDPTSTTVPPAAIDISQYTFKASIRKTALSTADLGDFDCEVTDGPNGLATCTLGADATAALVVGESVDDDASQYVWDLSATDGSGNVSSLAYGVVSVLAAVAR